MTVATFADVFSGIGGFRIALEQAGLKCLYSCEISEECRQVYATNFAEIPDINISEVDFEQIPDINIITAGFPCQPFSICGKRQGFADKRGTIFFYLCELIKIKQPEVVILENVKHLLHVKKGDNFRVMIDALKNLNYFVTYQILNAKDFGLPQNRERVFIVASKYKPFNFSQIEPEKNVRMLKDFLGDRVNFEYLDPAEYTLIENPKKQDSGLIFVGYRNKSIWKTGIRPNTKHLSRVHRQPNRIYSIEGVHPTLPSQETSGRFFIYLPDENRVRKLTIQECYRIMGFPEDFKRSQSLSESYKQIGNSVAINVVYKLIQAILQQDLLKQHSHQNHAALPPKVKNHIQLTIPGL
ncbi:MAG: DNA cytosine methyltransferase [Jaaginema sp. PMC 1079.18]|nr:DNA cytosine methyltransferase [Jaaginema sp. PMC 1080.18]MEC4851697.1 DNA cytosine methyltransferase [Jaaginema sp. PMC 1079.18]MEC4867227.1 DNA cytosine methyltransferase [Jaaginema sp. PMC 1078.18]